MPSGQTQTHRHRTYLSDDFPGEDWEERHAPAPPSPGSDLEEVGGRQARGGSDGAPPRLVPESGKLERVRGDAYLVTCLLGEVEGPVC